MEMLLLTPIIILKLSNLAINSIIVLLMLLAFSLFYFFQFRKLKKRQSPANNSLQLDEKEFLRQLFDNMPDRIYYKDSKSRFILANKHVASIMGAKNATELIGKTDFDYYEKEIAQEFFNDEQDIMKGGVPLVNKEELGYDLNQNRIFVSTTKIPIHDSKGRIIGIVGIGRDISKQKQQEHKLQQQSDDLKETNILLEERQEEILHMAEELNAQAENLRDINTQLEKLSIVASQTENIVIIMDGNGNFTWANKAFEKMYGTSLESFIKTNGENLRENSSNGNISAILNQIYITKKPFSYASMIMSDSEEKWYQTNITPILNADGEITKLILIDSEISDLKRAEKKIKRQKLVLEKQAKELEIINTTKDRLFSIIAHDLRNPFHSILGFSEILQLRYMDIEKDKLGEYLNMIHSSSQSAFELLENLLDWARTQTNRIKYKPVNINLKAIVNEVIPLLSLHASNKEIKMNNTLPDNLFIYADKNMVSTIIRNITSNSIKYTNNRGEISFRGYEQEDEIVLEIADTGVGMPEEKVNSLFKLEKISSTAGTEGEMGTGLGLIVCDEFMRRNKASISVESVAGRGTKFFLHFTSKKVHHEKQ